MLKSARVPNAFLPPFERAEAHVEELFGSFERRPEEGTLRVGDQRYVLLRCESLYASWFDAMAESFGAEMAREFVYNTAREIGRSDSRDFCERLGVEDGVERLSSGPVHFAHAGWAFVDILGDSRPTSDEAYFLHYQHPNTFESEVLLRRRERGQPVPDACACLFSAGYSAGWCSEAFGLEVHAREVLCSVRGDSACEFIMAPASRLGEHERRLAASR